MLDGRSSHLLQQSGRGSGVSGAGDGFRGNTESSRGRRGRSRAAEERITGGRRGGGSCANKVRRCCKATIVLHISTSPVSLSCRAAPAAPLTKSSSVGGEICSLGRNNDDDDDDKKRRSSFGAKMMGMVGLGKKSQSASQLNPEGESLFIQHLLHHTLPCCLTSKNKPICFTLEKIPTCFSLEQIPIQGSSGG